MHHIHVHNEAVAVQVAEHGGLVVIRTELSVRRARAAAPGDRTGGRRHLPRAADAAGRAAGSRGWCASRTPRRASLAVHRRVLGPAVEFGHEFNGIVCNAADLDAPNPGADPVMARYSQKLLQPALAHSARFGDRVRQLIVLLLPRGLCRVEVVAQHLGVDRRTVHRKLQAEGTSFSALLEAERRELARALHRRHRPAADRGVGAARLCRAERVLALAPRQLWRQRGAPACRHRLSAARATMRDARTRSQSPCRLAPAPPPNTPPSPRCARRATPRSRSPSATSTASCAASTCTRTSSSAPPSPSGRRLRLLRRGLRLGLARRLLRQHPGHRLAARLPRRAGAAGPGHRAPRALGRRRALLPGRVRQRRRHALPGVPAPDAEARAAARREAGLRADGRHGVRVVQLRRDAAELGRQAGRRARADHARHVRLLAAAHEPTNRELLQCADGRDAAFGVPIEGLHTETGPGVYEAAIAFSEALEQADRAILFKTGAKEIGKRFGIMPSFMAKWSQQLPGLQRPHPPEPVATARATCSTTRRARARMSKLFESYLAGQVACLMEFAPMIWPTINSYKRLVDGFWAPVKPTWGIDNRTASFRVIAGSPKATRLETRCPGADVNPYLAMAAVIAAGPARRREGPEAHGAADHRHQPGRRAHPARAAHADRDDARLPANRPSPATGSATPSSTTSPPPANGSGASGWTASPTGS